MTGVQALTVRHGDSQVTVAPGEPFVMGRGGDFSVDDNPHLHRRLLSLSTEADMWWLANIGQAIPVSVATVGGEFQALLGPGGRLPLVFPTVRAMFTAGPSTYEVTIECPGAAMVAAETREPTDVDAGDATRSPFGLTDSQRLLVVALAESVLRAPGAGLSGVPTSGAAAERLGWPLTTFNRKLDAVCEKLDRAGVEGLRGGPGHAAQTRKARLVEYSVLARLVTAADLHLLDHATPMPSSAAAAVPDGRTR